MIQLYCSHNIQKRTKRLKPKASHRVREICHTYAYKDSTEYIKDFQGQEVKDRQKQSMGKTPEQELYKKNISKDQKTYEKLLTSSSHQGNENQDHNTVSLYIYQDGLNEKEHFKKMLYNDNISRN